MLIKGGKHLVRSGRDAIREVDLRDLNLSPMYIFHPLPWSIAHFSSDSFDIIYCSAFIVHF